MGKECYICKTKMESIDKINNDVLGKCIKYKCPRCNEIVLHPVKDKA